MEQYSNRIFLRRKADGSVLLAGMILIYCMAAVVTRFRLEDGIASFGNAVIWITKSLRITPEAMRLFPKVMNKLCETALLSVAVTVIASIFAFIASVFGSRATGLHGSVNRLVRALAALFRNVPDVVWAMILLFSFGQNILTGFFALFFTTFGMLTRAFIETMDEVSADCVEALHAAGAGFMQTVFQGILPSMITSIITWVFYMIETNIRSSTLIGILTATGIGYLLDLYYKRLDFAVVSLIVAATIGMVIAIEIISNTVRKVIG